MGYLGGPNISRRVLILKKKKGRKVRVERLEDVTSFEDEGTTCQGMQVASRSWQRQGRDSPQSLRRNRVLPAHGS